MMYLATAVNDRDNFILPAIISLFTFGRAYHSELVFSNGESVTVTPNFIGYTKREFDWYEWSLVPLPMISPENEKDIRNRVDAILNTKPEYDYLGAVFGQFGSWANCKKKWYCSELCRHVLNGYIDLGNEDKFISPTELWKEVAAKVKAFCPEATQNRSIKIN